MIYVKRALAVLAALNHHSPLIIGVMFIAPLIGIDPPETRNSQRRTVSTLTQVCSPLVWHGIQLRVA